MQKTQTRRRDEPPPHRAASGAASRLYERAFEILSRQIRSGALDAGSKLQESAIAKEFGVSRAPVRRALQELEDHGLIEKANGHGFIVRRALEAEDAADRPALVEEDDAGTLDPRAAFEGRASWEPIYHEVASEVTARMSFGSWRLNEARLALHYGVSRTVARDVAARLQQAGVIRKDDRSRWLAPALTPKRVAELYEMRALLEPVALERAAEAAPRGLLERMRENLLKTIAAGDDVDGAAFDALEEEMHVELLSYCSNETLMQAIALNQSLLIAHRFLYHWTPHLFDREPLVPEHLKIVDLLLEGAIAEAAAHLSTHLTDARSRAVERIKVINDTRRVEELPYLTRLG